MSTSTDAESVARVAAALTSARRVLVITGAGLSADSGLPTYRGVGGLYDRQATDEGVPIEVALSGPMLRRRPDVCWKYIAQIEAACRGAAPNDGHRAIAWLATRLPSVTVLTQNVDGLHRKAGSTSVIEIHGEIGRLLCTRCDWVTRVSDYAGLDIPPACPACGSLVRPAVVLFEEALPEAAVRALVSELARGFDVVLSVGTTSAFPYIAEPVWRTRDRGGLTVEINPGDTAVSAIVDVRLQTGAAAALSAIRAAMGG